MRTKAISISRVRPEDLKIVKEIGISTFTESFAALNSKEDMDLYVSAAFKDPVLLEELKDPEIHYYILYVEKEPVGYLKLNFGNAQKEFRTNNTMEIERIYVKKEFQGQNLGQHLYLKALDIARDHNMQRIWLGVWEKNDGAIRFYKRNGFAEFDKHIFRLGTDEQTDLLMKLEL